MAFPIEGYTEAWLTVPADVDPAEFVRYWVQPLAYAERADNGEESPKGLVSTVEVAVKGDDVSTFLNYVTGFSVRTGAAVLSRTPPLRHPLFTASKLYVRAATLVAIGDWIASAEVGQRGWPVYSWYKYRLEFDTRSFKVRSDTDGDTTAELRRYVTRRRWQQARERIVPSHTLRLDDGKAVSESAFVIDRYADWTYTWHQVPFDYYPRAAIANCLGLVNDATWDTVTPEGELHPAESLLFQGVTGEDRPYQLYDGTVFVDLVYRFKRRYGATWNQYLKADGTAIGWQYSPISSPAKRPYKTANFDTLFRVA